MRQHKHPYRYALNERKRPRVTRFFFYITEISNKLVLKFDTKLVYPYKVLKALKAGYLSTISLEIKGTGVDVSGVKVYPWDTSVVPGGDNDATLD